MKIISRYVVREHVGPFAFAVTALTSLMLLNYIAKNFAQLVGKGLRPHVILEFFALALPFTVAMTLPMAVLVAVLYAFQRLAAENEITAFKASGVSMQRLTLPAMALGALFSLVMLGFNDQILPRANHRLATLQSDIFRASPTFALKEQVINPIKEGQLYLKAGRITRGSAHMKEVVLYDLTDPVRRRTIYADSGKLGLSRNGQDLYMTLYHGVMRELPTDKPDEVTQLYYEQDLIRVRGVATQFQESSSPREIKSDREMSICEMQTRLDELDSRFQLTVWEYRKTVAEAERGDGRKARDPEKFVVRRKTGLGRSYCKLQQVAIDLVRPAVVKAQAPAQGQTPPRQDTAKAKAKQDSTKAGQDTSKARRDSVRQDSLRRAAADSAARAARAAAGATTGATSGAVSGATSGATSGAVVVPNPANPVAQPGVVPGAVPPGVPGVFPPVVPPGVAPSTGATAAATATPNYTSPTVTGQVPQSRWSRVNDARDAVKIAREARNRFAVEIQKKFSLAAACFIFVLIGAPLALRFPRGGVGMVIGVSLGIFALSYVGLIGGEALADKGLMSPFWAMWTANIILFAIGVVLTARMGRETSGTRGGGFGEWWQGRRARRAMRRAAARPVPA